MHPNRPNSVARNPGGMFISSPSGNAPTFPVQPNRYHSSGLSLLEAHHQARARMGHVSNVPRQVNYSLMQGPPSASSPAGSPRQYLRPVEARHIMPRMVALPSSRPISVASPSRIVTGPVSYPRVILPRSPISSPPQRVVMGPQATHVKPFTVNTDVRRPYSPSNLPISPLRVPMPRPSLGINPRTLSRPIGLRPRVQINTPPLPSLAGPINIVEAHRHPISTHLPTVSPQPPLSAEDTPLDLHLEKGPIDLNIKSQPNANYTAIKKEITSDHECAKDQKPNVHDTNTNLDDQDSAPGHPSTPRSLKREVAMEVDDPNNSGMYISPAKSPIHMFTPSKTKEFSSPASKIYDVNHSNTEKIQSTSKSNAGSEDEKHNVPITIKYISNEDLVPSEEFTWADYLEETGSQAAPPKSFEHVEASLKSSLSKGMKLEVLIKNQEDLPEKTYWVASIVMECGQLLRMRYVGMDGDGSSDFWCDVSSSEIHPVGWCHQNDAKLQPPYVVKNNLGDNWEKLVLDAVKEGQSVPSDFLEKTKIGLTPLDQIKRGMRLEIEHEHDPNAVWLCSIIDNIGGRLFLQYEGAKSSMDNFWLFYLNYRLHPIGWALDMDKIYKPPKVVHELPEYSAEDDWKKLLKHGLEEARKLEMPPEIFKDMEMLDEHNFEKGQKLEILHPFIPNQICPGTVSKILDEIYFMVSIDDLSGKPEEKFVKVCCHANSPCIFPINWALVKGIKLKPPNGWKPDFSWPEYLKTYPAPSAPESAFSKNIPEHGFKRGHKLEAVNPQNPNQICAATITRIIDNLMWLHLDGMQYLMPNHIVDVQSHDIFPVGWCQSNNFPLCPPKMQGTLKSGGKSPEQISKPMSADEYRCKTYTQIKTGDAGSTWCPKIYFNHKCFSGPFLSKGRISELPRHVGPGPVELVMKEVLSMLISVAYKSCRVLRELQLEGQPNPNMMQHELKAKYKGKSYRASVEICKTTDRIEDFCRSVCIKLECCPYIFSPHFVGDDCPEKCSQLTKTKYTYYYGKKKKKVGRPPGGHSNLDKPKGPPTRGRKRKKRRFLMNRMKPVDVWENSKSKDDDDKSSVSSTKTNNSADMEALASDLSLKPLRKKRKYEHRLPPPSMIRTRGVKLPKFSFERRTHRKIPLGSDKKDFNRLESGPKRKTRAGYRHEQQMQFREAQLQGTTSSTANNQQLHQHHQSSAINVPKLSSNPLFWPVNKLVEYIKETDCASMARILKEQEIDGQAFLLLNLPTVQEFLELKLGPAVKLCHQVEQVKIAFFEQYAN